jgi:hypothetical protein
VATFVDTQEALLAWMADTLQGPYPAAVVRPAGEPIQAEPEEAVVVLNLADGGGAGGPFATAMGVIQVYGDDIQAAAIRDTLETSVADGYFLKAGITIRGRWYAQYIQLGGGHKEYDQGWPVLIFTITAPIDRKRGA